MEATTFSDSVDINFSLTFIVKLKVDGAISESYIVPSVIGPIKRINYTDSELLLSGLSGNTDMESKEHIFLQILELLRNESIKREL